MKKTTSIMSDTIRPTVPSILLMTFTVLAVSLALSSCNVTRTITTRSEAWQKGDTSVVIQSKTIETYDASKK